MPPDDAYACDYLIIGGGAAGLSLAYHLAQEPRLADKRVVVVEPESVKANDRTWRYWATGSTPFEAVEAHRWAKLVLRTPTYEHVFGLGPYRYRMVRAQDFYTHVHQVLAARPAQFTCLSGRVVALTEVPGGVCARLADGQSLRVRYAFDSRLPALVREPTRYRYLEQHFRGWEVETDHDAFDPDTVQFMDFRVPQRGQARFVYTLPFSKRRALVEFTVFSPQRLPVEEYETELRRYLAAQLAGQPYRIVAEEGGSIPMTDHPLPARASAHVLNLGTRAGRAKPSTGYTFARIQRHSARLVQALATTGYPPVDATGDRWQFRLFDTLLLDVIQRHGDQLGGIFADLFHRNAVPRLFAFLDEQTSWRENYYIMRSVTPWPFLQALGRVLWSRTGKRP
ncbi:lycopene cyclase [Hymenobacter amundsenii]|uniref:Lycopene cyclase n=1 Tax=Hymenobacter amundsenii TaxID=2006685 RepID=A0A246FGK8_9BACT|nr:FAD-dependent oxidoreductase [Hymenobacter amundsenii]OWP61659.1 lycopene cyclase [Hymenobacter amundsenii]